MTADEPPRLQFSLRAALLLTPVLAALAFLHVRILPLAVIADAVLVSFSLLALGLWWLGSTSSGLSLVGFVLTMVAGFAFFGTLAMLLFGLLTWIQHNRN
jgi:hypothetical protein